MANVEEMKDNQINHSENHEVSPQNEEVSQRDVVKLPRQEHSAESLSFTRLVYAKAPPEQEEVEDSHQEEIHQEDRVETSVVPEQKPPAEHDLSFTRLVYAKAPVEPEPEPEPEPELWSGEEENPEGDPQVDSGFIDIEAIKEYYIEEPPIEEDPIEETLIEKTLIEKTLIKEDLENTADFSFAKFVYEQAPPLPNTEEQEEPLSIKTITPVQTPEIVEEEGHGGTAADSSSISVADSVAETAPSSVVGTQAPSSVESQDDLLRQQILALMPGAETIAVSGKTMRQKIFGGDKSGKLKRESSPPVSGDTQYKKITTPQSLPQVQQPKSTVEKKEAKWETSGFSTEGWVLRSGLYALVGLLAVIGGYLIIPKFMPGRFGNAGKPNTEVKRLVKEKKPDTSTKEWRAGGGAAMREKAMTQLRGFMAAETDAQKARFLREPGAFLNFSQGWSGLENLRLEQENEQIWSLVEDENVNFLLLRAKASDFTPFHVIFVRSGDSLLIDWDASVGWSSIKLEEMADLGAFDSVMVRCVVEKGQLYTEEFPETEYSCYMLAPRETNGEDLFWAYTALDSDLDKELRALMNHGMFNVELREKVLVTLNVSKDPQRCSRKQLILDEMVHEGWVAPTSDLK